MQVQTRPRTLIKRYASRLMGFAGRRRLARVGMLVIGGAVLEGFGLALLVPMLEHMESPGHAGATGPWLAHWGLRADLPTLLLIFVGVIGVRAGIIRLRDLSLQRLRLDFIDDLRAQLQRALAQAEWRFLSRIKHADVTQVMVADLARVNQGTQFLTQGMGSLTMGAAGLAVASAISPSLTALALGLALGAGWLMRSRLNAALRMGADLSTANRGFFASLADFLSGLKIIKASATETTHLARFDSHAHALNDKQMAFFESQANTRALFEIATAALLATLLWIAHGWLHLNIAQLLIIVAVFARLLPLARDWNNQFQQLMHMLPAFQGYEDWLLRCAHAAEPLPGTEAMPAPSLRECLSLQEVGYRHEHSGQGLHGVTLKLPARTTTALVGPSGAGKTTLADLIQGLLAPEQGCIAIDGMPLQGASRHAWRGTIAYVPQDAFMFPDTIGQNLRLFKPDASDEALWQALEQAGARAFVSALPLGLATQLGERGSTLSGGERQRLALARALLAQPQLLVLDEATSHLDTESEQKVQAALSALHGRMSILVIAHRLSTVRHADQIVVLEAGRVTQTGSWHELAQAPGLFQRLLAIAA